MQQQQHRQQRIGVFADVQNLYYSAKSLYNAKVNFKEVLKDAIKGRQFIRAIAYCIRADIPDEGNFYEALENIGFEVKAKHVQIRIVNLLGQEVFLEKFTSQTSNRGGAEIYRKQIDLRGFRSGIYHLQVMTAEGIRNKKILLE